LNRGGGWKSFDYQCRASGRDSDYPFGDFNDVGFRVVRTP
jgi:formylglycine-generating enzyme required for sulfatase activity